MKGKYTSVKNKLKEQAEMPPNSENKICGQNCGCERPEECQFQNGMQQIKLWDYIIDRCNKNLCVVDKDILIVEFEKLFSVTAKA